jgi:SAM-dependent methyltransferase
MSPSDLYLLGHGTAEEERLQRQAQELAPESRALLDQVGIRPGDRAIDIGCGPAGTLELLSELVGANGKAVGLERSEPTVRLARNFAAAHSLANVEIHHGDAKASGLPRASFDVVHARLVLVNVPEPQLVVDEMAALARPGGAVASHEADWQGCWCDPPSAAWDRLFSVFHAYSQSNGIDLFVGRKTHRMLRAAGLVDVQVKPIFHVCPVGHPRRAIFWDFMGNLRDGILATGLIGATEFDQRRIDLKQDLDDPGRLVVYLYFQVWGRKPN